MAADVVSWLCPRGNSSGLAKFYCALRCIRFAPAHAENNFPYVIIVRGRCGSVVRSPGWPSPSPGDALHARKGLLTIYLLEVVPIISAAAGGSDSPCSMSATSLALWKPSSVVRRVDLQAALGGHVAGERHEVNGAVSGVALPRSITPTDAFVMLTNVILVSSVVLFCVACCM